MTSPFSLAITAAVFAAGLFLLIGWSTTQQAQQEVSQLQLQIQARDVALSGLNLTAQRLGAFTHTTAEGWVGTEALALAATAYQKGTYATTIVPMGDTVHVTSTGTMMGFMKDGTPRQVRHIIEAQYIRPKTFVSNDTLPLENGVPHGFNYAIFGERQVTISGNVDVNAPTSVGALDTTLNANVHSNGLLQTNGNAFLVQGHGTYAETLSSSHPGNFVPLVYEHPSAVLQTPPVQLPQINLEAVGLLATYRHAGPFTINGSTFGYSSFSEWATALGAPPETGTRERPFVLVVDGALSFSNRVALSGYALIVATGGITIAAQGANGGVIGDVVDHRTTVSMFTPGQIQVQGNASVTASLFGDQGVRVQGNPQIKGSIVSGDAYSNSGGSPSLVFALPAPEVILPAYGRVESRGLALVNYGDWPVP